METGKTFIVDKSLTKLKKRLFTQNPECSEEKH